ncbi:MAG TPA: hypothetical protein VM733_15340 [Thermoanaerobaculia bacterium]|nr:hypothetical protein [Thermoanaerobaculia bacterium]
MWAGTATVKLISYQNYITAPNSQTFTLNVQPYSGSTNCSSGGGATSVVNGVGDTSSVGAWIPPMPPCSPRSPS